MNKDIIGKLIKIEKLKYEVIKDILPEKALLKLNNFERELTVLVKDIALDFMRDNSQKNRAETKNEVKKVKVDFL